MISFGVGAVSARGDGFEGACPSPPRLMSVAASLKRERGGSKDEVEGFVLAAEPFAAADVEVMAGN